MPLATLDMIDRCKSQPFQYQALNNNVKMISEMQRNVHSLPYGFRVNAE